MGIEQYRDRVAARVKQAMAQSGVDLSTVPADQQDRLVNVITDNMLFEFDAVLSDGHAQSANAANLAATASTPASTAASSSPAEAHADETEHIVWEGRPFLSLGVRYVVTSDRIRIFDGLVSRTVENIELMRVQDIDYHQGVSERIFGIGDITITSKDATVPTVMLNNVKDPEVVANTIRTAWIEARKRRGVAFRDFV